jgi:hypothetical protein
MPKKNVSSLEWFLDFLNLKIGNLSHGDRLKWITETLYMIELGRPYLELDQYHLIPKNTFLNEIQEWDRTDRLEKCQKALDDFWFDFMSCVEDYITKREDWISGKYFGFEWSFAELDFLASLRVLLPIGIGVERKPDSKDKKDKKFLYRINRNAFSQGRFHIALTSHNAEVSLLLAFCQNLEDIPFESLRKCPECRKWFLHLSKKEKVFCSNKCAARKGSRQRRQQVKKDDPKTYKEQLAQGAKRARKSYVKKQKAKNPKAKIGRRPTKHKDI